jgi:hypothetical protein
VNELFSRYDKQKVILTGDFNFPDIIWSQEKCNKGALHPASKFFDTVQQNYLSQLCSEPTHYRGLQNPNILDLVLVNNADFVSAIEYLPPLGKSHHPVLCFNLLLNQSPVKTANIVKYNISRGDYDQMRDMIGSTAWEQLLSEDMSVDECWQEIMKVIQQAKDTCIPKVKLSGRSSGKRSAVPHTMLDKIHLKRRAFKMYKKYPTQANYNAYAKARNQVKWESRKMVKERESLLAKEAKVNPKKFYQYVSSRTKSKESVNNLLKEDGSLTQTDADKADVLNVFFSSVFTKESDGELPSFERRTDANLSFITVSVEQMSKALQKLKVDKSPGPDQIHPKILKELCNELAYPFKVLFDKTMIEGKIPKDWKEAEVRPLFKKGDKSAAGNYRPVSLTSVVCKLFEGFIRDALCNHLVENDLLSRDQFGFTKGRSCVTQLLVTLNDWLQLLDKNLPVDAVYLDLRKAFDTVPHRRLIHKLQSYGINGNLLSWIQDFLSGRTQYVSVNGTSSAYTDVSSGVPQGSVLGPSLFIYYINDLPDTVDCKVKIFADDTKAYSSVETVQDNEKLQSCIDNLTDWTDKWLLQFNSQKCKVLHLGKNNVQYQYVIRNGNDVHVLESTVAERDLGVIVDPLLNFDTHISETVKKGNKICGLLVRTIENKSPDIMIPLFKSLVRPILEYGNVAWAPYLRKYIDLLEGVQRRFTKKVIGMSNLEYSDRLEALHLPSLEYRRLRGDLIEVYKM